MGGPRPEALHALSVCLSHDRVRSRSGYDRELNGLDSQDLGGQGDLGIPVDTDKTSLTLIERISEVGESQEGHL